MMVIIPSTGKFGYFFELIDSQVRSICDAHSRDYAGGVR